MGLIGGGLIGHQLFNGRGGGWRDDWRDDWGSGGWGGRGRGVAVDGVEGLTAGTIGMIGGGVAEEADGGVEEEEGGVAVAEDVGELARI